MPWNWQLLEWPDFQYDTMQILQQERQFLLAAGKATALLTTIEKEEHNRFIVEILSTEGIESSKIEGETLDRSSLQSSIKKHFGLQSTAQSSDRKESAMAQLLHNVYESFDEPLTHAMLYKWHSILFKNESQ